MVTKYVLGRQPGREVIRAQGRTITGTARAIGVAPPHLHQALSGRIRPNTRVRERLPALLGVPLTQLFTPLALQAPKERRLAS